LQVLRDLGVKELKLTGASPELFDVQGGLQNLAAPLSPSLTSFSSDYLYSIHRPATFQSAFPGVLAPMKALKLQLQIQADGASAPALQHLTTASLKTIREILASTAQKSLHGLVQRLPELTRLHISTSTSWTSYLGDGALDKDHMREKLSSLQELAIHGGPLLGCFWPLLHALPALTSLELARVDFCELHLGSTLSTKFGLLSGLKRLSLKHGIEHDSWTDRCGGGGGLGRVMEAARQLRGLTELALGDPQLATAEMLARLLPAPPLLRRVVVRREADRQRALRVLGGEVDSICLAPGT
jgi:hypothetical protein